MRQFHWLSGWFKTSAAFTAVVVLVAFVSLTISHGAPLHAASNSVVFDGSFSQIQVQGGGACDAVFAVQDYALRHTWFGSGGRTSVLHFRALEPSRAPEFSQAFFDAMTLVGRNGYSNDVFVTKNAEVNGLPWRIAIEGMVDPSLIWLIVTVRQLSPAGAAVCMAKAEFSGFQ